MTVEKRRSFKQKRSGVIKQRSMKVTMFLEFLNDNEVLYPSYIECF